MINTQEEFTKKVSSIQEQNWYKNPIGFGICRVDLGQKNSNKVLQATFPVVNWNENFGSAAIFLEALKETKCKVDCTQDELVYHISDEFVNLCKQMFNPFIKEAVGIKHQNVQIIKKLENLNKNLFRIVFLFKDDKPKSVESTYLKLYALSCSKVNLRSICLDGAFGILENIAWAENKPIELQWLRENEIELKMNGNFPVIDMVDKFPRFLSHIIPSSNTRILDTSKVRFGAQIASGTTVMPGASYINFNAGTTGSVMVEGRISSSAIVGDGSDIGGGASILGVLSGTDGNPISIGKNTLLGANSTTGISLGDGCIVDGGVAIFAGTIIGIDDEEIKKLKLINKNANIKSIIKAKYIQGLNGMHFRQDSQTGKIIVKRSTREIKLNSELH